MAAHRKSDQRRDDVCAGLPLGKRERFTLIFVEEFFCRTRRNDSSPRL
jgi:hypothetical protein